MAGRCQELAAWINAERTCPRLGDDPRILCTSSRRGAMISVSAASWQQVWPAASWPLLLGSCAASWNHALPLRARRASLHRAWPLRASSYRAPRPTSWRAAWRVELAPCLLPPSRPQPRGTAVRSERGRIVQTCGGPQASRERLRRWSLQPMIPVVQRHGAKYVGGICATQPEPEVTAVYVTFWAGSGVRPPRDLVRLLCGC